MATHSTHSSTPGSSNPGNVAGDARANGIADSSHPVTDKLKDTLHSSVDKLAGSAGRAEENLRKSAHDSAENWEKRKGEAEQKWQSSSIRKYAIENPLTTAGIAFAAGMLLTSIFRSK
ncbi:DUF883 domain-containing protein [Alteromonas sp. ASW11-130]|uniref:DUF883 domain-containing protein n=1 Tax=Alteromonas sp. ASW11-130 TaxID=3015775 RepID=UPI00224197D5|nr:DUF883 domain-containing protein [Alteromonas sp. ASW11-130]MCW8090283.1 DUF883 domain-containing protein [Alteromonas sp. ASW11-130]